MQNECTPILDTGLRGASVASTKISDVNGKLGKLLISRLFSG
jgi:citrate synthase